MFATINKQVRGVEIVTEEEEDAYIGIMNVSAVMCCKSMKKKVGPYP